MRSSLLVALLRPALRAGAMLALDLLAGAPLR